MGLRRSQEIINELEEHCGMDLESWVNYWRSGSDDYKTDELSIEELRDDLEIISRLVVALVNDATDNEEVIKWQRSADRKLNGNRTQRMAMR